MVGTWRSFRWTHEPDSGDLDGAEAALSAAEVGIAAPDAAQAAGPTSAGGRRRTLSQSPPRRPRRSGHRPAGSYSMVPTATTPRPTRYQPPVRPSATVTASRNAK